MIIYKCDICEESNIDYPNIRNINWNNNERHICIECVGAIQGITGYNIQDADLIIELFKKTISKGKLAYLKGE